MTPKRKPDALEVLINEVREAGKVGVYVYAPHVLRHLLSYRRDKARLDFLLDNRDLGVRVVKDRGPIFFDNRKDIDAAMKREAKP